MDINDETIGKLAKAIVKELLNPENSKQAGRGYNLLFLPMEEMEDISEEVIVTEIEMLKEAVEDAEKEERYEAAKDISDRISQLYQELKKIQDGKK